jgi:hypothetical protein
MLLWTKAFELHIGGTVPQHKPSFASIIVRLAVSSVSARNFVMSRSGNGLRGYVLASQGLLVKTTGAMF